MAAKPAQTKGPGARGDARGDEDDPEDSADRNFDWEHEQINHGPRLFQMFPG
jgi:hypothetical protein